MQRVFLGMRFISLLIAGVTLAVPLSVLGATFYLDSKNGDNRNDGLSPSTAWKSIPETTRSAVSATDEILFKQGDRWVKQLDNLSFGSLASPITPTTRDDKTDQILLGSEIITGWVQYAATVWQSPLGVKPSRIKSNATWLTEGFDKDRLKDNQWYWESNTLYVKDVEGNPDSVNKTIIAFRNSSGWSVTSGDFNGDGLSDVVTADSLYDGINFNTGEVYLYYGRHDFSTTPDQILIDPDGKIGDGFGFYVASAGDINNDGFDELIVSTDWGVNKVYLYMGSPQGLKNTPDLTLTPPEDYPDYGFGHAISLRSGDLNGDGFDDILIGGGSSPTYFCVYYGSPSAINAVPDAVITYPGTSSHVSLSSIGDTNNDGFDDIAVSIAKTPPASAFEVYLYTGSSDGITPDNPQRLTIPIPIQDVYINGTVAPAGDVNGDGFADLLIGNPYADGSYQMEGKAYIFYGSSTGVSTSANVIIDNPKPGYNVRFGHSADGIGDFNYDGFDDVIVGCPDGNFASIYYGSPQGITTLPALTLTEVGWGWFGWSVSRAGDIQGTRQNFIIVGEEFGGAYLYALRQEQATVCSTLGDNPNSSRLDQDVFTFEGTKAENVTIRLAVDTSGFHRGERANLILMDEIRGVRLFINDQSALPNTITAILPATGKYRIGIAEQLTFARGKGFEGDYCLTLNSSTKAWQTLKATQRVE